MSSFEEVARARTTRGHPATVRFMAEPVDLSTPASRREALRTVAVDDPGPHHAMLRAIFDLERAWRERPDDGDEGDGDESSRST